LIEFAKAHACGNDFLIVEEGQAGGRDLAALARALCARTTGMGADGVEFLARFEGGDGRIRLHNADGSVAEISGNGTRCVAAWIAHESGLHAGDVVRLETDAGLRICTIQSVAGRQYAIATGMGVPRVARRTVVLAGGIAVEGVEVSTGNPHFVLLVDGADFSVAGQSWQQLGAAICTHPDFPAQTNVEFARRVAEDAIEIRIYERGVGPTSSSGTGTSASAAAIIAVAGAPAKLRVRAPGGEQLVEWAGGSEELRLTGPAVVVARGQWLAEDAR
jgi:diaminopimelate epimerase